jgi:hypothetical protein
MANLNDTYASLLSAYSGSVNDKRSELLASILGYTKALSLNDMEKSVLTSLGYTGALNDAWDKYIRDLGGSGFSAKSDYLSSTFYGFYGSSGSLRNLLKYTEQFDNAIWNKSNLNAFGSGSVANTTVTTDPTGRNTADLITENTLIGTHSLSQAFGTAVATTQYTQSAYLKDSGTRYVILASYEGSIGSNVFSAQFDLQSGTITGYASSGGTTPTGTITPIGNGWFRCTVTFITTLAGVSAQGQIWLNRAGTFTANPYTYTGYIGNGTSGIYIWGAQLELGSTATAYQKVVA